MHIDTLLGTTAAKGRVCLAAQVALAHCSPDAECPRYFEALRRAINDEPPPFDTVRYADIYQDAANEAHWMAVSLITNAEREGDGAKRLWSLSACSDDSEVQLLLKRHAVDESRHALLYLALLDIAFGHMVDSVFRLNLNELSPHYSLKQALAPVPGSPYAKNPSIDDFLQMNIAEIRTAVHHIMQRPALAQHCPPDVHDRVVSIQNSLLRDELKHISYTAVLIERVASDYTVDRLAALFRQRFHDFNQITLDELGRGVFDCSVACCAGHSSCRPRTSSVNACGTSHGLGEGPGEFVQLLAR